MLVQPLKGHDGAFFLELKSHGVASFFELNPKRTTSSTRYTEQRLRRTAKPKVGPWGNRAPRSGIGKTNGTIEQTEIRLNLMIYQLL